MDVFESSDTAVEKVLDVPQSSILSRIFRSGWWLFAYIPLLCLLMLVSSFTKAVGVDILTWVFLFCEEASTHANDMDIFIITISEYATAGSKY
jgi:hypothetical protein